MHRLLGISGCKTAGKSTLADYFVRNGPRLFPNRTVRVFGFADTLKEIVHSVLDIPREVLFGDDTAKGAALPGKDYSARDALKSISLAFLHYDPLCWTRLGLRTADRLHSDLTIFADVRFPWEVEALRARGGVVIRLMRDPFQDPHPSERALDGYEGFDAVIDNRNQSADWTAKTALAALTKAWGWPFFKEE